MHGAEERCDFAAIRLAMPAATACDLPETAEMHPRTGLPLKG
jgi:hypothetical protein